MILSASFVSLMSSTNFFLLRLDRFIQLLKTFSVVISLEFVFSNLCLTVRENLFSLSLQESPNLFTLRVVSLSFLGARHKWANNGSHRSIMTDWRRQTGRQAFFFRVIGSSSARVKERLADGDVIVVEVIRVPLLARGLLGVFDISLCDEVVVGLKTLLASHSVSSRDRSSNFGALGLRWWCSPGQISPSEGFWSRMSAWRATAFVNFTRRIGFRKSELFRKIDEDFGGSISWNTQPNCRVFDELHTTGLSVLSYDSCFFNMATALLSPFFLDLLLGCSSTWRCA